MKTLKLKDIKAGQKFVEEDMGYVVPLVAIEDAREVSGEGRNGYELRANVRNGGDTVTLFECHEPGPYGLRLYAMEPGQDVFGELNAD